jgi:hypothetical protein
VLAVVVVLLQRRKNENNAQCLLSPKQSISLQKTKSIYIYICTKDSLHKDSLHEDSLHKQCMSQHPAIQILHKKTCQSSTQQAAV